MYGVTGMQADSGPAGTDGADGASAYEVAVANGFVGDEAAWLASLVGAPGADGAQGPQGDPGPAGADGAPGADGPQGDPGPAGADGDPGAPGVDGLSAYDIAVNAGFIGDEVAWLASLVGPQGDPGPAGADGEPGADGAQGDPGPAGADGVDGAQGDPGPAGADGEPGADGAQGDPGPTGPDGLSAYEVAVANGFVGDEAAWLASLVGASGSSTVTISGKTGAYTVVAGDLGAVINCTANTFTVSLTAAATLGAGFHCWVWNTSNTSSHVITIDPNSTETIDGATTLLLRRGEGCQIVCDGTNWQTGDMKKPRLYSENAANNATRPIATGGNGVAIGNGATASGSNGVAIGNTSQAVATSTVAIGDNATALGVSSVAIGTGRAATQDSVAIAITDSSSTYGAKTNTSAVAIGQLNIASGAGSVVIGGILNVSAASYAAVIGGDNAQMGISASNSAIVGGTMANSSAGYGVILGGNALIQNVKGKVVSGTGSYARISNGEAQTGTTTLMGVTTSATPVVLTADKSSASTSNQLLLTDKQSMVFRGKVVAKRKGSESATSSAGWEFSGVIRRGDNAASTALVAAVTPTLIAADTDAAAWTIAVTADTTNGALAVTVTGEASKSILWVCTLHSTEALYN